MSETLIIELTTKKGVFYQLSYTYTDKKHLVPLNIKLDKRHKVYIRKPSEIYPRGFSQQELL